jgi:dipeptidyl aminopeptidase/acylaminoacyl peptidase
MRLSAPLAGLVLAATLSACTGPETPAGASAVTSAPLIERADFFGNPTRAGGQLSPDGNWLSWVAPREGVLNVWVARASDPTQAKALTSEKARPIRQYFWSPDSTQILYVNDKGGDENFLLYGVDVTTGQERALTPFEKTRVTIVNVSPLVKDRILVGLNNRDPRWHDVHSLDLKTGQLSLVLKNEEGFAGFTADENLVLRMATKARPDGGADFFRVVNNKAEPQPFESVGLDDSQTTAPLDFTADGKTLYWVDSRDRDKAALVAQDVASGEKTLIAQSDKADIGGAMVNPATGVIEAYSINYLKNEWTPVGDAVAADMEFLRGKLEGEFGVQSRTLADDKWLVGVDPVTAPPTVYVYDRQAKTLTEFYVTRPELSGATLAAMHPLEIQTRDGLTMVSYLTLPPGSDANGDGRPDHPVPTVLFVHGGPWGRDTYGYNAYHQWLSNRGYAVLSPNFRGSAGFGKAFLSAGNLEWGAKMHDDLIDTVEWALKEKVTSADKVAIMGGSYGGYATLVGLTFTPDKFACGVDIVGPSNLNTLLKTIPPYWEAGKAQFYNRMGNPTTPEGQQLLNERSPLFKADQIKKPLLIGQGANDPRVNVAESEQIVAAMKEKDIPVTYVVFPDEGHGFARPENNIAFAAVTERFLANCLGGRAEPYGAAIKTSTMQVPHGVEYTTGLDAALQAR